MYKKSLILTSKILFVFLLFFLTFFLLKPKLIFYNGKIGLQIGTNFSIFGEKTSTFDESESTSLLDDFKAYEKALKSFYMKESRLPKNLEEINSFLEKDLSFYEEPEFFIMSNKEAPHVSPSVLDNYILSIEGEYFLRIYTKNNESTYSLNAKVSNNGLLVWSKNLPEGINVVNKKNDFYDYSVIDGKEIALNDYFGHEKELIIPSSIDGLPVTVISESDIYSNEGFARKQIDKVHFPTTLEYIGYSSFSGNDIRSLTIPSNVKTISGMAFYKNMITELIIEDGVQYINNQVFLMNYLNEVKLPKTIKKIGESAFAANPLNFYEVPSNFVIEPNIFPENSFERKY